MNGGSTTLDIARCPCCLVNLKIYQLVFWRCLCVYTSECALTVSVCCTVFKIFLKKGKEKKSFEKDKITTVGAENSRAP